MPKLRLCAVLFALLSGFSLTAAAAEPASASQPAAVTAPAAVSPARVDLNSADAETLARELDGIGEAKARAIVEYRQANGAFTSVDELLEVKGIGAATLEKNRARLSVN
ncbi:ComEA family DNA-binding protein [Pseudomonas oryzae]|uniref:Competence protein ComEA n=1 Tax=Pseudomonas oryzae TaxID=1392877 RepID=A0A1H1TB28_9PSED|nr:helix-hairpin-helix domain-containing protein [Pseudomonas oryzae]SDS57462.1 competence protein ComEA [Pseudomonas oryzae]